MVPMMKASHGGVSVVRMRRKVGGSGFSYWTHYKNDTIATTNTIGSNGYKEIWPNQYNYGAERVGENPVRMAYGTVGNIGTLLYVPGLQYRPAAGMINNTGYIRAENAEYDYYSHTFKPLVAGSSSAEKFVTFTTNNEVTWPAGSTLRLNTENSFWNRDFCVFSAFAYYLLYVYNMDLSLDTNPLRWNVYSRYKINGTGDYTGENNFTQDAVAEKVIDGIGYEAWLIKSKPVAYGVQGGQYTLMPDNPYRPESADCTFWMHYVDFPTLKIAVNAYQGWFQVVAMGMEFWCETFKPV